MSCLGSESEQKLVFAFLEVEQQTYDSNSYCDYGSYD